MTVGGVALYESQDILYQKVNIKRTIGLTWNGILFKSVDVKWVSDGYKHINDQ
jgi:hypothetical protein